MLMMRNRLWAVGGGALLLALGLLFARLGALQPAAKPATYSPETINLALRRTAHYLLRTSGDSVSRIPAVQQLNARTFRVQLSRAFLYDSLPGLLRESLRTYQITTPYEVAVLDCATQTVQLGYSVRDLANNEVPCVGRAMAVGCYVLQVTFAPTTPTAPTVPPGLLLAGSMLVMGTLLGLLWRRATKPATPHEAPTAAPPTHIDVGQSRLDPTKQTLTSGQTQHTLTYREAKLLRLLASHPNEVLERDLIMKQVWEDEGVIVGRSLDVFISRLRKLLSDDPTIKIAAIHGVGYRLEVS